MCDGSDDNPFCLNRVPTDPYNWIYHNGVNGPYWYYAIHNEDTYEFDKVYFINNEYYYCGSQGGCQESSSSSSGDSGSGSLQQVNDSPINYKGFTSQNCPSPPGYQFYAQLPNKRTGSCEKTPINDPCVNPCVRLENGSLAVNSLTSQCRVFPNVTEGGNASINNNSCPTVCPNACVELWESCPPGSGPLTTLAQTKTPIDLFSLSGPYRSDSAQNPFWPSNYANFDSATNPQGNPILGKPYTECYSYNTEFCDLPMGWQETIPASIVPATLTSPQIIVPQTTSCYSSCPKGTYPDPTNSKACLFLGVDGTSQVSSGNTNFQKVFCNPQYFNPIYMPAPNAGIQKGCEARPLPSKQGSSCPEGTMPVVNEFFGLEWCLPNCPQGYFFDLTQSTCVATCQGTTPATSAFNQFLDIFNFYATTNRCNPGVNCIQDNTPGRCPIGQTPVKNSQIYNYPEGTPLSQIPISHNSVDPTLVASSVVNDLQDLQNNSDKPLGQCPANMSFGKPNSNQLQSLCYDNCDPGYIPVEFCANGQAKCSNTDLIFACRALCPSHNEGLGPWREINLDTIFTCAYNYPGNVVPSDPNLWATCPDDGRYTILQNISASDASVISGIARKENLCIRKSYLRRVTCPLGFTQNGSECLSACDASDTIMTSADGSVICQASNTDTSRHDNDLAASADAHNAKEPFKKHVLTRKAFSRGLGTDPNTGLGTPSPFPSWTKYISYFIAALVGIFILFKIL